MATVILTQRPTIFPHFILCKILGHHIILHKLNMFCTCIVSSKQQMVRVILKYTQYLTTCCNIDTVYSCVLCSSYNNQPLFPTIILNSWIFQWQCTVLSVQNEQNICVWSSESEEICRTNLKIRTTWTGSRLLPLMREQSLLQIYNWHNCR